ncbi:MAG: MBL fold metallo-hydrolase [Hyphomicrobiales bacterium]|nr:MAG: MBL fold metallo-hydrolase [Hyphomicrobiales bacterium]
MNRRNFLKTVGISGISLFAMPLVSSFATTKIQLGNKIIRSISDGHLQLPMSFVYPDIEKNLLEKILTNNGLATNFLKPECNLTLLEDGEKRILFDAGAGANFMASAGKLFTSLEDKAISLDSITDVIFTHGHPDHIWGIVDDFDEISFPNAKLHFPRVEWDFWRADDTFSKVGEERKTFVIGARNRLEIMEERIVLFNVGDEVLPGIEAVDTAGHTPGHCSFAIHHGSQSLMVIGDAITNHIISFSKPDWPTGSDQDTELGAKTRKMLLERLATDKMQIIGYHLPNGGVGHVERKAQAFQFIQ